LPVSSLLKGVDESFKIFIGVKEKCNFGAKIKELHKSF
jgi:hypothetical protein